MGNCQAPRDNSPVKGTDSCLASGSDLKYLQMEKTKENKPNRDYGKIKRKLFPANPSAEDPVKLTSWKDVDITKMSKFSKDELKDFKAMCQMP